MSLILKGFGGQKVGCQQENAKMVLGILGCGHLLGTEGMAGGSVVQGGYCCCVQSHGF